MNSKKCKQLRKIIYGDYSNKTRSYVYADMRGGTQTINHPDSPRAKYQAAKKRYKARKRAGKIV